MDPDAETVPLPLPVPKKKDNHVGPDQALHAGVPEWLEHPKETSSDTYPFVPWDNQPSVEALKGKTPGFEVLRFVGAGGMGWVYQARQISVNRRVALKILRADRGFGEDDRRRFLDEAQILANLQSNVGLAACITLEKTIHSGELFYVSEWVEGQSIASLLDEPSNKRLPVDLALDYVIQAGKTLAATHAQKILHRDVKPGNLMVTSEGRVKVIDFGLAIQQGDDGKFDVKNPGGSPGYAAPEQWTHHGTVDERTDVYGLAATLYRMITGVAPTGRWENPSVLAQVDTSLDLIMAAALHISKERRPYMPAFVRSLECLRSGETGSHRQMTFVHVRAEESAMANNWAALREIVRASPGANCTHDDGPMLVVECLSPCAGATLGLRLLLQTPASSLGMSSGLHQITNNAEAQDDGRRSAWRPDPKELSEKLAMLAGAGQFLVDQSSLELIRTLGMRDPSSPEMLPPFFHVHGEYTWPVGADVEALRAVVGQIHPGNLKCRDPFLPPSNPVGGKPVLDTDADWQEGEQLAAGQPVELGNGWILQEKLGTGGYGEVWLATHPESMTFSAFKFCRDASRLEAFRKECKILRYLARALPEEPGFLRLLNAQLFEPPFWLQTEYYPLGNLGRWLESSEGPGRVPLEMRIDVMAKAASLVASAHAVGVIHRDLKLSNILVVAGREPGSVWPVLADFGLSGLDKRLIVQPALGEASHRELRPTQSALWKAGTRLYAAPEEETSEKSDVFAMGVMLFQVVSGRLDQRPEEGWKEEILDAVLVADIAACVHKESAKRPSARDLEQWLRRYQERRAEHVRSRLLKKTRRATLAAGGFLCASVLLANALAKSWSELRVANEKARFGDAMKNLSQFIDYTQLKKPRTGHVGVIRSFARAVIDLDSLKQAEGGTYLESLDHGELIKRLEFELGLLNSLQEFAADESTVPLETALAKSVFDGSRLELEKTPEDPFIQRLLAQSALELGRLLMKSGQPQGGRDAFECGLSAMEKLLATPRKTEKDFLLSLDLLARLALQEEEPQRAAAIWHRYQDMISQARTLSKPSPLFNENLRIYQSQADAHLKTPH